MFIKKADEYFIAGVNSGGECCKYGSVDEYKRLATNWKWI